MKKPKRVLSRAEESLRPMRLSEADAAALAKTAKPKKLRLPGKRYLVDRAVFATFKSCLILYRPRAPLRPRDSIDVTLIETAKLRKRLEEKR